MQRSKGLLFSGNTMLAEKQIKVVPSKKNDKKIKLEPEKYSLKNKN